jgi:hypothetical protein
MSSTIHAIATRTIAISSAAVLALASTTLAASTIDELGDLSLRAWAGETELLSEVYAPDGVHTATFYDRTNEYVGPEAIDRVAGNGQIGLLGPRIDIPTPEGEWSWASFSGLAGGSACLFHAVDGQITRHDCVLPEKSFTSRPPVGLADAEASAAIDEVQGRLRGSWGPGTSVERLAEVYAPDAVHSARYLNTTKSYEGLEQILAVARLGHADGPEQIGDRVDFEAPEGELAWAQVVNVAGGSVCLYRAVDGMITRHDCVLPING